MYQALLCIDHTHEWDTFFTYDIYEEEDTKVRLENLVGKTILLISVIYKLERVGFPTHRKQAEPISQTQTTVLDDCWSLNLK